MERELIYIFRILIAGICGILVGIERKNRSKEAGIRTHFVVSCGAALIMIVSKYAFFDVAQVASEAGFTGEIRLDPSRVASTIASGIGFLGAGMIFINKNTIKGLTTAAGIWAVSGVGMAIGAGCYVLGVGATLIILVAQLLLHLDFSHKQNLKLMNLSVKNVTEKDYQKYLADEFEKMDIKIQTTSASVEENGDKSYLFTIELPEKITEEEVLAVAKNQSSIKPCL